MTVAVGTLRPRVVRTIRSSSTINALRQRIDSLQVLRSNQACTAQTGSSFLYAFKTSAKAAPYAQVFVDLSGCGTIDVEVHGHPGAELISSPSFDRHLP